MRWLKSLWLVALLFAADSPAPDRTLPAPAREGWQTLTFPKINEHTRYYAVEIDGRKAARAEASCSASGLLYPLDGLDLLRTPLLSWEWRVDTDLKALDHRRRAGDDFAARVYVLFEFQPERASAWQRLRRRAARSILRVELPGRALNYVWSAQEKPGAVWDNPFTEQSKMISRGAGQPGAWRREEVDVVADYRRAFGETPPRAIAVALMTDTDNSCQKAVAYFATLTLRAHPSSVGEVQLGPKLGR